MKKEIVRRISTQQLIVSDVMSLNGLCSIDCKQDHNITTNANDETNHKIKFLSACHPNVDFFLYWYKNSQIRDRYLD